MAHLYFRLVNDQGTESDLYETDTDTEADVEAFGADQVRALYQAEYGLPAVSASRRIRGNPMGAIRSAAREVQALHSSLVRSQVV